MPIFPDQSNIDRLIKLMSKADAHLAERREVNTALTFLAVTARVNFPTAKFLVFEGSDQGDFGYLLMITTATGEDVLDVDESEVDFASDLMEGYDSWLYDNHRDAVLPYLKDGLTEDDLERMDRDPWRGVVVDIDKVLAYPPALIHSEPTITIPYEAWQPVGEDAPSDDPDFHGDDHSRLLTSITINGQAMHLEAYEVVDNGDEQEAVQRDEDVALFHNASGADGKFDTIEIGGRDYVLFATPHS